MNIDSLFFHTYMHIYFNVYELFQDRVDLYANMYYFARICMVCALFCVVLQIYHKSYMQSVRHTIYVSVRPTIIPMEREFLTNRTYKGRVCIAIGASLTEFRVQNNGVTVERIFKYGFLVLIVFRFM